jgi:hypothetical protein
MPGGLRMVSEAILRSFRGGYDVATMFPLGRGLHGYRLMVRYKGGIVMHEVSFRRTVGIDSTCVCMCLSIYLSISPPPATADR